MSNVAKQTIEPEGHQSCPSCGGKFESAELMAVHLVGSSGCRRDLIEQNRIQLLRKDDPYRRLILTDSLYLTIHRTAGGRHVVRMCAMALLGSLGELVVVDRFYDPQVGRRRLKKRRKAHEKEREGVMRGFRW